MKKLLMTLAAVCLVACGSQKPLSEEQYTHAIQKSVPFAMSQFKQLKENVYSFRCDRYVDWLPDYEVNDKGATMVWRTTFDQTHTTQPPQYIWRNIVIDKRANRILCIDRLLRDGLTSGYVYVLQGETKTIPDGCHWDVTDQRHMMITAPILENQTELSVELLKILLQK